MSTLNKGSESDDTLMSTRGGTNPVLGHAGDTGLLVGRWRWEVSVTCCTCGSAEHSIRSEMRPVFIFVRSFPDREM